MAGLIGCPKYGSEPALNAVLQSITDAIQDGARVVLTPMECGLLAEPSVNAGRVLTHERLRDRAWGASGEADTQPIRTIVSKLRRKLGEDADGPTYIFTEPRGEYWMPAGETGEE